MKFCVEDCCLSWEIMISQPFVLLRKWILSMIVVGQAAGTPPDKSESNWFESETHIGALAIQIIDRIHFRSKTNGLVIWWDLCFFSWDNNFRHKISSMMRLRRSLLGIKTHPMGPVGVPRIYLEYPEPQKKIWKISKPKSNNRKTFIRNKTFPWPDFILEPTFPANDVR